MIDLGAWANEEYRVPVPPEAETPENNKTPDPGE